MAIEMVASWVIISPSSSERPVLNTAIQTKRVPAGIELFASPVLVGVHSNGADSLRRSGSSG
jgi:hypothetical protein